MAKTLKEQISAEALRMLKRHNACIREITNWTCPVCGEILMEQPRRPTASWQDHTENCLELREEALDRIEARW